MNRLLWIGLLFFAVKAFAQPVLPVPDHIVMVILENKAYSQITGSSKTPHINAMAIDSGTALFTQSYAIEHPSQPNYLDLFSGTNQGVKNDQLPETIPFTSPNLARQLLDAGKTFITYSEDLPHVGFDGESSGNYVRRHNPAANWMGTGVNQVPPETNQPFSSFPADFNLLPTICLVVPNLLNDMHDGTLNQSDQWIFNHLNPYIQWAKKHNSLFILTFDEDNYLHSNHILTFFSGEMVKAGFYSKKIDHYNILRTLEDMFGLPYAGNAAMADPITDCWAGQNGNPADTVKTLMEVYSNPFIHGLSVKIPEDSLLNHLNLSLTNLQGVKVKETAIRFRSSNISLYELSSGFYIYQLIRDNNVLKKGKVILK